MCAFQYSLEAIISTTESLHTFSTRTGGSRNVQVAVHTETNTILLYISLTQKIVFVQNKHKQTLHCIKASLSRDQFDNIRQVCVCVCVCVGTYILKALSSVIL